MDLLYDIHCHIVPSVDDGSRSLEMSMELLAQERDAGVGTVICTPHFQPGMFEPEEAAVRDRFFALQEMAQKAWPDLTLYLGCEMHRHSDIIRTLKERPHGTLADSRYVLTEFSSRHGEDEIRRTLTELRRHGYVPVIAHAERYPAIQNNLDFLADLRALGCQVQINADSIIGIDGFGMKRLCKKMMDKDLVDYVASDAHRPKERPVRLGACAEYLRKKRGEAYMLRLLSDNPSRIVKGEK